MSKKRKFPSIPPGYARTSAQRKALSELNDSAREDNNGLCDESPTKTVSYVEHSDGRRFFSDRFYLNQNHPHSDNPGKMRSPCKCGNEQPPPEFPLLDFVNNTLDVKAAVMGTFNLHPEWFRSKFPRFGSRGTNDESNSIPTMILHGHRGLENALKERVSKADEIDCDTDGEIDCDTDGEDVNDKNGACSYRSIVDDGNQSISSKFQFFLPNTSSATKVARDFVNNPNLLLCQVFSKWDKSKFKQTENSSTKAKRRISIDKENNSNEGSCQKDQNTVETKFGVYHPKFMLLFERSGDLVVIVSTSNLTPSNGTTVEGSWVQRFQRRRFGETSTNNQSSNDFGPVLQDFLVRQAQAAAAGVRDREIHNKKTRFPLEEFLHNHIGLRSLNDFASAYKFEAARAYLVPVVPGDFNYCQQQVTNPESRFHYGRQRVRYILENLAASVPKISKQTKKNSSKSDRLLIQPTSLGGDWSRSQWASLIREYMGYFGVEKSLRASSKSNAKELADDCAYHRDDFWVSRQADILWPSDPYMLECSRVTTCDTRSDEDSVISHIQAARTRYQGPEPNIKSMNFNSSRTFNTCDLEVISRMALYHPSEPSQFRSLHREGKKGKFGPDPRAPHFKSIARLFPNHSAMFKRGVPPADAYFSWFLMTSACLSLGAQGMSIEQEDLTEFTTIDAEQKSSHTTTVEFRNFELGVLFVSHLPKKKSKKTLSNGLVQRGHVYCFHPKKCSCAAVNCDASPELVHLPVPYKVQPDSYFIDRRLASSPAINDNGDEDIESSDWMIENPFFHEILDGSRCIGNMLLTPFGREERNLQEGTGSFERPL